MMKSLRGVALAAALAWLAPPAMAGQAFYDVTGHIAAAKGPSIGIGADEAAAIGQTEISTTIFVMGAGEHKVKGVLMRDLVKYAGGKGTSIKLIALDGYAMDIPMSDFENYDAVVATEIDGKPLSVREHGPAWLIYPASQHPELKDTVYESRSVWQIKTIEID